MRYKLFYCVKTSIGYSVNPAHKTYYTDDRVSLETIFSDHKNTNGYVFTLNHSPEEDPKFKNLYPLYNYKQAYIAILDNVEHFRFLLVSERSPLFNYKLLENTPDLRRAAPSNNLHILDQDISIAIKHTT